MYGEYDKEFLVWLHERLVHVHGEKPLMDYMHRLRAIIENTYPGKRSFESKPLNDIRDALTKEEAKDWLCKFRKGEVVCDDYDRRPLRLSEMPRAVEDLRETCFCIINSITDSDDKQYLKDALAKFDAEIEK